MLPQPAPTLCVAYDAIVKAIKPGAVSACAHPMRPVHRRGLRRWRRWLLFTRAGAISPWQSRRSCGLPSTPHRHRVPPLRRGRVTPYHAFTTTASPSITASGATCRQRPPHRFELQVIPCSQAMDEAESVLANALVVVISGTRLSVSPEQV
jgi:hypothetical protein